MGISETARDMKWHVKLGNSGAIIEGHTHIGT